MRDTESKLTALIEKIRGAEKNPVKTKRGWRDYFGLFMPTKRKIAWTMILVGSGFSTGGARIFLDQWNQIAETNAQSRKELYDRIMYKDLNSQPTENQSITRTLNYSSYAIIGGLGALTAGGILLASKASAKYAPKINRR